MGQAVYTLKLCDRKNTVLSDVTSISFQKTGTYRLSRPASWSFVVPLDRAEVYTTHTDGHPYLDTLRRALKVYRTPSGGGSPVLIFNGLITSVERSVDENTSTALVTAFDPMWWWQFRVVRDSTGDFASPTFASPISGAAILKACVQNSVTYEGTLGLDTSTGTFDTTIPPAYDLSATLANYPLKFADLATLIFASGACDAVIDPVESPAFGLENGLAIMGRLNARNRAGADQPTIHFDLATGDYSIAKATHVQDAAEICNKLYYYLGPRVELHPGDKDHWKGNVTADDPGLADPPQSTLASTQTSSRSDFGVFMDVSIYDDGSAENARRPLFERLWQNEFLFRSLPREMFKFTPIASAPYLPFENYNLGDTIRVNAGGNVLGFNMSGVSQRVYGFDVMPDNEGVERLGEIVSTPTGA